MIRLVKRLGRATRGAATIELALVAPILATMVMGVSDISIAYGKKLQLEQAAQRAIEKVAQTTGEATPEDTIKIEAKCQYNGTNDDGTCKTAPLGATNVLVGAEVTQGVVVEYSLKCNGVATVYTLDCAAGQTEVRYISASVSDTYTPMFPVKFGTQADGSYHLVGVAGVRVQ